MSLGESTWSACATLILVVSETFTKVSICFVKKSCSCLFDHYCLFLIAACTDVCTEVHTLQRSHGWFWLQLSSTAAFKLMGGIFLIQWLRNRWQLLSQLRFSSGKGISFWFYFHRCEGAASPEGPKAIVEGIIEEEEEEEEDDEGGVSVNKRKKEDDTEVGNFLLCFSMFAWHFPGPYLSKRFWYVWEQLQWKLCTGTFVVLLGLISLIPSWVVTWFLVFLKVLWMHMTCSGAFVNEECSVLSLRGIFAYIKDPSAFGQLYNQLQPKNVNSSKEIIAAGLPHCFSDSAQTICASKKQIIKCPEKCSCLSVYRCSSCWLSHSLFVYLGCDLDRK